MTLNILTVISRINPFNNTNEPEVPNGAEAVRTAISEVEALQETDLTATLGEPDIVDNAGEFFNDPRIIIPVKGVPFDNQQRLVFDLPEGRDDPASHFTHMLDLFQIGMDEIEEIEGKTVPVSVVGGNLTVSWMQAQDDDSDSGSDSDADESGSVSVKEKTFTSDDGEAEEEEDD